MPTFDRKSEKFELFEDFFQMSLKNHIQLTKGDRINYFQSLVREDELQFFKNNNGPTRENLGEILAVFRRNYVKPQTTQNFGQEVYHDSCLKRPSLWLRRKVSLRFKVYRKNQKVREIQDYQDFKAKIDGKIFLFFGFGRFRCFCGSCVCVCVFFFCSGFVFVCFGVVLVLLLDCCWFCSCFFVFFLFPFFVFFLIWGGVVFLRV